MKNVEGAIYLYCFARSDLSSAIEAKGLDGQSPLSYQSFLEVTAVIGKVPIEEFIGPEAESRMQDLAWVGPRVCRHEEVIEEIIHRSPVLPARFGTIFSSKEALECYLKENYGAITKFLDYVADKEEWGVRGMMDRVKVRGNHFSALLAEQERSLSSLPPGRRYFQEKRLQNDLEKKLNLWLEEVLKKVRNHLSHLAPDYFERKVLSRTASGLEKDMIANWAFLLPQKALGNFRARIDQVNLEYDQEGLIFELSGPWPPYSFFHPPSPDQGK